MTLLPQSAPRNRSCGAVTEPGTPLSRRRRLAARAALRRWRADEDGGIIIFSLFIFIVMLIAGGMAVDFMRTETARTKLQTTLDRAVLAAGDMESDLDPEAVVRDYVAKAGLDPFLVDVNISNDAMNRTVSATARANVAMHFARMIGIEYLPAPAASTAGESLAGAEIALVLDISGSMQGEKLLQLKAAASSFVDTITTNLGEDGVVINVIPYSTQVAVPGGLLDLLSGFTRDHDFSNCVTFDETDYDTTSLVGLTDLEQGQHFDPFYSWGDEFDTGATPVFVCNPNDYAEMLVMENDPVALNGYIDALVAGGNTSIDIGMKWAMATLDPSSGTLLDLFANGASALVETPVAAFNDADVRKIVVLMTDGAHTTEWMLSGIDMTAMSDIWYDDSRDEFWVQGADTTDADGDGVTDDDMWFSPRLRMANLNSGYWIAGESNFFRRATQWPHGCADGTTTCTISSELRQLKYAELYERVSLYQNAYYHHYIQHFDSADYDAWYWDLLSGPETATKNARLSAICTAAKDKNVTIYTVGFEVQDDAALVMEDCASSTSHFFRVAGDQLISAFSNIARQVTVLGLTK